MSKCLIAALVWCGLAQAWASPPTSSALRPHLQVEYWFNAGTQKDDSLAQVLVLFRNDSSKAAKINGSDYYPEVDLFALNGRRIRTKDEMEAERLGGGSIVTTHDYIPDYIIVPPHGSIARQYDFAPWRDYTLKTGFYLAKVKGSKAEFYIRFSK